MRFPRVALGDLFWLMLTVAILVAWGKEHRQAAPRLRDLLRFSDYGYHQRPLERSASQDLTIEGMRSLSDQQFIAHFADSYRYSDNLWLAEMCRRGMRDELRTQFDQVKARGEPPSLDLLTALRRMEGKPDPVRIHVELRNEDEWGEPTTIPQVVATLENVDVGREPMILTNWNGLARLFWRVRLTDGNGLSIHEHYPSISGMGAASGERLLYGHMTSWETFLDARHYIAPPPAGRYRLEVVHCSEAIADQDAANFIVWKSDPIPVSVEYLSEYPMSALPLLVILVIVGAAWGVKEIRVQWQIRHVREPHRRRSSTWRFVLPFALVAVLTIGWLRDSRQLRSELQRAGPDHEPRWILKLISPENRRTEGLVHLHGLTHLESLELVMTQVSDAGIVQLRNGKTSAGS